MAFVCGTLSQAVMPFLDLEALGCEGVMPRVVANAATHYPPDARSRATDLVSSSGLFPGVPIKQALQFVTAAGVVSVVL